MAASAVPVTVEFFIDGIGVLGPGLDDWAQAQALLLGQVPYHNQATVLPVPALLPPADRRRVGHMVKLALAIGSEAVAHSGDDVRTLKTVFSSSSGDGHICHMMCDTLAGDRLVSPTRFANSVHNAPAGYWAMAHQAMAASTSLCGYDASFGGGLLDAAVQAQHDQEKVLLLSYDAPYPEPLHRGRHIKDAMGIALVVAPSQGPRSLARIRLHLSDAAATQCDDTGLEECRCTIPSARGLPLLTAVAHTLKDGATRHVAIDYLDQCRIALAVAAC